MCRQRHHVAGSQLTFPGLRVQWTWQLLFCLISCTDSSVRVHLFIGVRVLTFFLLHEFQFGLFHIDTDKQMC